MNEVILIALVIAILIVSPLLLQKLNIKNQYFFGIAVLIFFLVFSFIFRNDFKLGPWALCLLVVFSGVYKKYKKYKEGSI